MSELHSIPCSIIQAAQGKKAGKTGPFPNSLLPATCRHGVLCMPQSPCHHLAQVLVGRCSAQMCQITLSGQSHNAAPSQPTNGNPVTVPVSSPPPRLPGLVPRLLQKNQNRGRQKEDGRTQEDTWAMKGDTFGESGETVAYIRQGGREGENKDSEQC